ncbi:phage tail protein [Pseudomonas nitroreducens]|uniref:phage tail protein n=1 Tax=Pseudomonas nitroreducens TaxID=46680 RepID=UPI002657F798|nr:phage tail protein [Pseudomonas nitroreducens]MCP1652625.1 phage protein U [Pseudomonas nitroreducens]MCP1689200.1 phage protein U [Pseudomonas nitroreducens]
MAYWEQMQSSLSRLAQAAEDGRRDLDEVIAPVNGAVSEIRGAAGELEGLPGVSPEMAGKVQRTMQSIERAQVKVNKVVNTYSSATRALKGIDERMQGLGEQVARARKAVDKVVGKVGESLGLALPTSVLAPRLSSGDFSCVIPQQHLLIMTVLDSQTQFFFNIDTVPFESATRTSLFSWKEQVRLGRRGAQQSVGVGAETLLLKAAVIPGLARVSGKRVGMDNPDTLRKIALEAKPVSLIAGSGDSLGNWCLIRVAETQTALFTDGAPRQQTLELEFSRYGDDNNLSQQ